VIKRTREGNLYEEFIYCGCGCGFTRPFKDENYRKYHFINGHARPSEEGRRRISEALKGNKNSLGHQHSEESKKKMSENRKGKHTGDQHKKWKGDEVGIDALHTWVRKHFPEPEFCMLCNKIPPYDLANITGILNREFKNWAYFCRKCHQEWDNTQERIKIIKRLKKNKNKLLSEFL